MNPLKILYYKKNHKKSENLLKNVKIIRNRFLKIFGQAVMES